MEVSEPEPGRVLAETDPASGVVSSFTVDPADGGRASHVTIATELPDPGGLTGALQRALTSRALRGIYEKELANLAAVAASAET